MFIILIENYDCINILCMNVEANCCLVEILRIFIKSCLTTWRLLGSLERGQWCSITRVHMSLTATIDITLKQCLAWKSLIPFTRNTLWYQWKQICHYYLVENFSAKKNTLKTITGDWRNFAKPRRMLRRHTIDSVKIKGRSILVTLTFIVWCRVNDCEY